MTEQESKEIEDHVEDDLPEYIHIRNQNLNIESNTPSDIKDFDPNPITA